MSTRGPSNTYLELVIAVRKVIEGHARVLRQRRLLQSLRQAGLPTERAETLLALLEITLRHMMQHAQRLAAEIKASEEVRPLEGTSVLVAEDEPILAFDIIGILRQAGAITIGPALSASVALELAKTEHLSCGVLDVRFRDGPVFPMAEVLRDKGAGVVFFTGQADQAGLKQVRPHAEVISRPTPLQLLSPAVRAASIGRLAGTP
jgi:CheY-like chemotaxis protein